jgi:spore maturation protein CgeB
LRKKLVYYLEHTDDRCAIADRGHRCVLENHTYVHRIKKVLSAVTGNEQC